MSLFSFVFTDQTEEEENAEPIKQVVVISKALRDSEAVDKVESKEETKVIFETKFPYISYKKLYFSRLVI